MKWIKYVVFGLVLAYVPMWTQTNLLLESLGKDKLPIEVIKNPKISELIKDKTGVDIETIKISESDRPFGMMMGVPGNPQLILSRSLYNNFSSDEIEYVILHEAGHYKLGHSVKELFLGLVLFVFGIVIFKRITKLVPSLLAGILLGLVFGVGMIQVGKQNELQSDNFSVTRMTNPDGMITATEKFRHYYGTSFTQTDDRILQWMFYRGNPYDNRIKMAEEEKAKRLSQILSE